MSGVKKKMICLMTLLAFGTNAQENGNSHPDISPGYLRAYKESLVSDIPDDGLRQYKKGKGDVSADDVPDAAALEHIKETERLELTGKKIKREFKTRFAWGDIAEASIGSPSLSVWIKNLTREEKESMERLYKGVAFHDSPYNEQEIASLNHEIGDRIAEAAGDNHAFVAVLYKAESNRFIIYAEPHKLGGVLNIIKEDACLSRLPLKAVPSPPLNAMAADGI